MSLRSIKLARPLLDLICHIAVLAPAAVYGQGSCDFDGINSKIENAAADVLAGSDDMTICLWVHPTDLGEGNGTVLTLDESGTSGIIVHKNYSANSLTFGAYFQTVVGAWSFPVAEDTWSAVAFTYNKSSTSNLPSCRVNFVNATRTPLVNPNGMPPVVNTGYCIGNRSDQLMTFKGRIAHVQVFNRVLSAAEMNASLNSPGSVTNGLRLWLPMMNAGDINDRSGNDFNGTGTSVTTGIDSPIYDDLFQFGVTNETRGQIVIPNSGNRGVLGLGPETSKLIADASVTDRFITTANYPTTPVDSATVAGLTLDGDRISTNTHPYAGFPDSGEWAQAEVADGVEIYAQHARITDCRIRGFRGIGATITHSAGFAQWGIFEQIDNCEIVQSFISVNVTSSDQRVMQNVIANSRDAGIRINDNSGSVQTANNHIYGAYRAYENLGGDGGNHVNDYYADAYRGIHLDYGANECHFTNCMVQHCWEEAAFIGGARNSFSNCRFECARSTTYANGTGVMLDHIADYTKFTGCQFGVNIWENPNATGDSPALAAIYIYLDEGETFAGHNLDNVSISGTAYTIYTRTYDVLMRIVTTSDGVRSMTVDIDVEGFNDSNDKLLVVDADTYFRNCRLVFRGDFGGNLGTGGRTLDDLFDLPTAWNGAMGAEEGNSITVYDTHDGDVHTLNMNATY